MTPRRITTHLTRDEASAGAATGPLKVAAFQPGTRAQCKCSTGECKESECNALYIFDESGAHLASFHGEGWRAYSDASNPMVVYRMPGGTTKDTGQKLTLADLNKIHQEFYRRGDL